MPDKKKKKNKRFVINGNLNQSNSGSPAVVYKIKSKVSSPFGTNNKGNQKLNNKNSQQPVNIETLKDEHVALKEQHRMDLEDIQILQQAEQIANGKIKLLNNKINEQKRKYYTLNNEYSQLKKSHNDLQADYNNEKNKSRRQMKEINKLRSQCNKIVNQYNQLQDIYNKKDNMYNDLKDRYYCLKQDYDIIHLKLKENEKNIASKDIMKYKNKSKKLQEKIQLFTVTMAQKDQEINELRQYKRQATKQIDTYQTAIKQNSRNSQVIRAEMDDKNKIINELKQCYKKLHNLRDKSEQNVHKLKNENGELINNIGELNQTIKALQNRHKKLKNAKDNNDREINELIKELKNKDNVIHQLNQRITSLEKTNNDQKSKLQLKEKQIEILKQDLANAHQTILKMTSIVDIKQKLPTPQEILIKYVHLKDQIHANTCGKLKEFIKQKFNNYKFKKYYINQIMHEILFNLLICCYRNVKVYKNKMFTNIANQLNMFNTIKNNNKNAYDNDNDNNCNKHIQDQIYIILSRVFSSYFKNHPKDVLKLEDMIKKIMNSIKQQHIKYINDIPDDILITYISECCEVCWFMILQDPILSLYPKTWRNELQNKEFDDDEHKRMFGSDKKFNKILYCVWPAISRNDTIIGNQKIDVMVRNALFTE